MKSQTRCHIFKTFGWVCKLCNRLHTRWTNTGISQWTVKAVGRQRNGGMFPPTAGFQGHTLFLSYSQLEGDSSAQLKLIGLFLRWVLWMANHSAAVHYSLCVLSFWPGTVRWYWVVSSSCGGEAVTWWCGREASGCWGTSVTWHSVSAVVKKDGRTLKH